MKDVKLARERYKDAQPVDVLNDQDIRPFVSPVVDLVSEPQEETFVPLTGPYL